jgi:GTP-binding protein HflX
MFFDRPEDGHRAVLLHLDLVGEQAPDPSETQELAEGAGLEVVATITGKRQAPHPRYFMGTGKLEEVRALLAAEGGEVLLLNHDIGAGQQRNLEKTLEVRVMPRTELILHIFADRARTHEGQLQVELAQLQHAQSRLVKGWTHLDRQKGGIGLRGAGEKQIEMDQRMLADRLKSARARLAEVAARRARGRERRARQNTRTVALVGYTNAGKSTLFNALTAGGVVAEDRLFATLDPTMRALPLTGVGEVVLADTVGFISHLPHTLVEAFKATLEEVAHADLLLHLVNAGSADAAEQIQQVQGVLTEIGADSVPTLAVLNKIDMLSAGQAQERLPDLDQQLASVAPEGAPTSRAVRASALTGEGLPEVLAAIAQRLGESRERLLVQLDAGDGATRAWLYAEGAVLAEEVQDNGIIGLQVQADERLVAHLQRRSGVKLSSLSSYNDATLEQSSISPSGPPPLQEGEGISKISPLPN